MLRRVMRRLCANRRGLVLAAFSVFACSTYDESLLEPWLDPSRPAGGAGSSGAAGGFNLAGEPGSTAGSPTNEEAGASGEAGAPASSSGAGHGGSDTLGGSSGTGGSSAGTSGGGGAGASGGAGSGGTSPLESIDDFERFGDVEPTPTLSPIAGRNGPWYVFADGTKAGIETDVTKLFSVLAGVNAREGSTSTRALHFTASNYTDWGAGVGADLKNSLGKKVAYDVSKYSGIRFYAKIGSGAQKTLKVLMPNTYSDPDGAKCLDTDPLKRCSDHLFLQLSGLKTTWDVYQVNFSALHQQGFGLEQLTFDPKGVYSIQFTLATTATQPVDLWIDDLSFVVK